MGSLIIGLLGVTLLGATRLPAQMTSEQLKGLSLEQLLNLEVTSVSRSPMSLDKAPSAIQVITGAEVRRSTASSLPEALRLATNLHVARKNAHDWGISARGFNTELSNKLLVLIDGRAVYTPLWSGVRWDVQDVLLEDLDRIEVISGPGGSLWGANAVNGVINVSTKSARDTQGWFLEAGVGNPLERVAAVRYGVQLAPQVFLRTYFKDFQRDDEELTTGAPAGDASSLAQAGFRLDADLGEVGAWTLQGDLYHGHEGVVGGGVGEVSGGNLLTRWSKTLASGAEMQWQLYYDRTYLRLPIAAGPLGEAGTFEDNLVTYDSDFQHRLNGDGPHQLLWGLGYRQIHDETDPAPALGFAPPSIRDELFSGFIQDEITLTHDTRLTVGTKVEHNDYTGWEFEPSVRLQRDVGTSHLVWGAISRAVRMPSRVDRQIRQPSAGPPVLLGGDFVSETMVAYELGFRGQFQQRLGGSISTFYHDYRDLRSARPTPGTLLPLVLSNDLEGHSHGLEIAFNADLAAGWRLNGGYTMVQSDLRVRAGASDINNALNETADPEHQWSLGTSLDLPGRVAIDARIRWVDALRYNNEGQPAWLPSYTELDVRLAWAATDHLELSVAGQNLLDEAHVEAGRPGPVQVAITRSVYAKAAWRF